MEEIQTIPVTFRKGYLESVEPPWLYGTYLYVEVSVYGHRLEGREARPKSGLLKHLCAPGSLLTKGDEDAMPSGQRHTHTNTHTHRHRHTDTQTHRHTDTHTQTHTHTHTHTPHVSR